MKNKKEWIFFLKKKIRYIEGWTTKYKNRIQLGLSITIVVYLLYQLYQVDLSLKSFWDYLPLSPLFFLLITIRYFQRPLAQIILFSQIWSFPFFGSAPFFFISSLLNQEFAAPSGDVALYGWAVKKLPHKPMKILKEIKDMVILSSLASWWFLLILSVLIGLINYNLLVSIALLGYMIWGGFILLIILLVIWYFSHKIFGIPKLKRVIVLGIHACRYLVITVLNILIYSIVFPGKDWSLWLFFIWAEWAINRIPLITQKGLLFAGLSVHIATLMGVSWEKMLILTLSVDIITKIYHLVLIGCYNVNKWIKDIILK